MRGDGRADGESTRRRRGTAALLAAATAAATLAGLPGQARAASACPEAYPLGAVTPGQTAEGLTVDAGSTPEPFDVTVAGVVDDGIAPGLDMILVDTDSPAIREAGGVWAGMSGSPVYAEDGRLVGAVAYGLGYGSSTLAGVTPAAEMRELLSGPAAPAPRTDEPVRIPERLASRLVARGDLTRAQAEQGLARLPLPVGLSGLVPGRSADVQERLGSRFDGADVRLHRAGGGARAGIPAPGALEAGGNVGASLAYGDVSMAAVGTVTAVCGDEALAFGHPFLFAGRTAYTAHTADVVTVQDDPLGVPFKVANLDGLAGTVDRDRLAGVRVTLGTAPARVPVRTDLAGPNRARDGVTHVTDASWLADVAWTHVLANLDRVHDRIGAGRTRLSVTIRGRREDGRRFRLAWTNRVADRYDATWWAPDELARTVRSLQSNRFEDVTVTGVEVGGRIRPGYARYRAARVEVRRGHGWRRLGGRDRVRLVAGEDRAFRVRLAPVGAAGEVRHRRLHVTPPRRSAGRTGALFVGGGQTAAWNEPVVAPTTFGGMLGRLRAVPRNDEVTSRLVVRRDGAPRKVVRRDARLAGEVVTGGVRLRARVVAPH
jgi:hypothetical protein